MRAFTSCDWRELLSSRVEQAVLYSQKVGQAEMA